MNKAHRDRIAFMRICSGQFIAGMEANHVQGGKKDTPFTATTNDGARKTYCKKKPMQAILLVYLTPAFFQ